MVVMGRGQSMCSCLDIDRSILGISGLSSRANSNFNLDRFSMDPFREVDACDVPR